MAALMQCIKPITVFDKTTGGALSVPCGQCMACRINRARMWSIRLMDEFKLHDCAIFCTLTYDDEHLPKNGTLVKADLQKFFKRLRKNCVRKVRYYSAAEYGDNTLRPHYHCIIYGLGAADCDIVRRSWALGNVHIGTVTYDSCQYVASYCLKKLTGDKAEVYSLRGVIPEFALMSRKPALGVRAVEHNLEFMSSQNCVIVKGKKAPIPRIYVDKLFSEADKIARHCLGEDLKKNSFTQLKKLHKFDDDGDCIRFLSQVRKQNGDNLAAKNQLKRRKL